MDLKYDISKYIASVKMSSKKRILVEGREDKAHISNLLNVTLSGHKIKIDTAENIKGDCQKTAKNNRAKIEKIHANTSASIDHENLFFLCDREFLKFDIDSRITDLMAGHENDGNLSWTIGHSLENYFIKDEIVFGAFRYLCGSEYKTNAEALYKKVFSSSLKLIAAITLAAKKIDKCSYPLGTIGWQDLIIRDGEVFIDIDDWKIGNNNQIALDFYCEYKKHIPIVELTVVLICSRICRGHTAIIMLQRTFAACLYKVSKDQNDADAEKIASDFSRIKEGILANALSESWVQKVIVGQAIYPQNLINLVA